MKTRLITACVATLCFGGCKETVPPSVPSRDVRAFAPATPTASNTSTSPSPVSESTVSPPPIEPLAVAGTQTLSPPAPVEVGLSHVHQGEAHLRRARELKADGDLKGAFAEVRRAVFDDASDEEALEQAGQLGSERQKWKIAAAAYGQLAQLRPDDALPLIRQGRLLLRDGDLEGAVRAGSEAIERDPENAASYHLVGRAHLTAGVLDLAIARFEQAIALEPDHGYALNNLGFAFLRSNQNSSAVAALERAAALLPDVAYIHNNLGVALERVGRLDEAKLAYARSTSLSPRYVKAQINAARVARVYLPPLPDEEGEQMDGMHPVSADPEGLPPEPSPAD